MFPCQSVITNNKNYLHYLFVNGETRTPALSRCHHINKQYKNRDMVTHKTRIYQISNFYKIYILST